MYDVEHPSFALKAFHIELSRGVRFCFAAGFHGCRVALRALEVVA